MASADEDRSLLDRQEEAVAVRSERRILEKIRPFVTAAVVEEHRANPVGAHSLQLDLVLGYLRRQGNPDMDQLMIVATDPEREFRVADRPVGDGPIEMREDSFETAAAATHRIFLDRLASLGLEIQEG
jgi:hypothetical protein